MKTVNLWINAFIIAKGSDPETCHHELSFNILVPSYQASLLKVGDNIRSDSLDADPDDADHYVIGQFSSKIESIEHWFDRQVSDEDKQYKGKDGAAYTMVIRLEDIVADYMDTNND